MARQRTYAVKHIISDIISIYFLKIYIFDIPEDVFHTLNLKAAALGINLKKYIEQHFVEEANEMDDAEIFRYLVATRPEGQVMTFLVRCWLIPLSMPRLTS